MKTSATTDVDASARRGFSPGILALALVLVVEAAALLVYLIVVVTELVRADASNAVNGLAYVIIALIAVIWVAGSAVAVLRRQPWVRGAVITWQLIQLVIGAGCLEGLVGVPSAGWLLIAAGVVGFALVVSPPVSRALAR